MFHPSHSNFRTRRPKKATTCHGWQLVAGCVPPPQPPHGTFRTSYIQYPASFSHPIRHIPAKTDPFSTQKPPRKILEGSKSSPQKLLNCNLCTSFFKLLLNVFSFVLANAFLNYLWSCCYKILSFL